MSKQRKMVRYQRDQARAAQQMAWQNGQVSAAQTGYYRTQTQIAADEAEARRIAALPLVCAHCQRSNPPGSRNCSNCGSMAFLPPVARWGRRPSPPKSGPAKAWAWFRGKSTRFQALSVSAVVVALVIAAASAPAQKDTMTATAAFTSSTTLAPAPATTPAPVATTVAPIATPPTTAVPAATVTITGSPASATVIVISNGATNPGGTQVALPVTYTVGPPSSFGILVSAETSGADASATITCTIRFHDSKTAPVVNTATGPFSFATCQNAGPLTPSSGGVTPSPDAPGHVRVCVGRHVRVCS